MELIEPSQAYAESYKSALEEFEKNGISGFWKFFGAFDDPQIYIQRMKQYEHKAGAAGSNLVPASVYWLVDRGEFIGHVSIRHELNDALYRFGGNIGYAIRPGMQRKGYGSALLRLALSKANGLGIRQALVTCDKDNSASRKIIEKNGGRLQDEIDVNGKTVLRFWVPTPDAGHA